MKELLMYEIINILDWLSMNHFQKRGLREPHEPPCLRACKLYYVDDLCLSVYVAAVIWVD